MAPVYTRGEVGKHVKRAVLPLSLQPTPFGQAIAPLAMLQQLWMLQQHNCALHQCATLRLRRTPPVQRLYMNYRPQRRAEFLMTDLQDGDRP